jgi:mannose-1-phosphate guanylyltransferase
MTQADFVGLVREQTPRAPPENVVCEPMRRNTAPAVILAAVIAARRWPGSVMVVMPSDHIITNLDAFRRTVGRAVERARRGGLGTIGIPPTFPSTAFGYLRVARSPAGAGALRVERFVEKPDRRRAEVYAASGRYLWNSGIFVWKAQTLLEAAARHLPQVYRPLSALADAAAAPGFPARARAAFKSISSTSIDYGVMEKAQDVWAVPAAFGWSDVGSWLAAADFLPRDPAGNHVRGNAVLSAAYGNVVITESDRPLIVAGVSDCVIVQGPGGALVCHKGMAEELRAIVERLHPDRR